MKKVLEDAIQRHIQVLGCMHECVGDIEKGSEILNRALRKNKKIMICGNGGSAADSQHFAAEWVCKYKDNRQPYAAIALTTDTSVLTAVGNDYGYHNVFSRQILALGNEGDVLVAFTTSGASENIKSAIEAAVTKNVEIIIMTGRRGSHWKDDSRINCVIIVPSEETARIQEMHELIYHAWCEGFDQAQGVE